ncbi:hypothetical protein [Actinomadura harenae]|uniref:hypothetical protein n=1 Tax=Actinomadura harenae TaxID=2483351 RepID=UPI0011C38907|nr:hypothetical protein [Actinomadura harenae]
MFWPVPSEPSGAIVVLVRRFGEVRLRGALVQVREDLRRRRNLEAHAVTAGALACALLSVFGDLAPQGLRWAVLTSGVALLVARAAASERTPSSLLGNRQAIEDRRLGKRLSTAREVWLFAPSGKNVLTSPNGDVLRRHVLSRSDADVRVVVLDDGAEAAVRLATRQLTEATRFPGQPFPDSLRTAMSCLRGLASARHAGAFRFRVYGFNPGFSIFAVDPTASDGAILVELHGVRNGSTADRMHLWLTRLEQPQWYDYWCDQFRHIWATATAPSD